MGLTEMSRNIPLNLMRVFFAAAQQGSFKLAAEELSLTTSAVSQSIKKLEDLVGVNLFARKSNKVYLTPVGAELMKYVEAGLDMIAEGLKVVSESAQTLTVFIPPGIASLIMPQFLDGAIAEQFEDIRMLSNETSCLQDHEKYDIAVFIDERAKDIPNIISLGPDHHFPFASSAIAPYIDTVDKLSSQLALRNVNGRTSWEEFFAHNHTTAKFKNSLTFSRASQLFSALDNERGVGIESMRFISSKLKKGEYALCNLPDLEPVVKNLCWLYINPRRLGDPRIPAIRDLIHRHCHTNNLGIVVN